MKKTVRISAILFALVLAMSMLAACELPKSQEKQLIGKWVDTSNIKSGYEFSEDNKVTVTYIDLGIDIPIINQFVDGKVDGIYTTDKSDDKNTVSISYTVLQKSITKSYYYSISDNVLTLTDIENGTQTVYRRADEVQTGTQTAAAQTTLKSQGVA